MKSILIRNAQIINRGSIQSADLYIQQGRIEKIAPSISRAADIELDAKGCHVFPGIIDDQVHFREPGLTHKATIATESRAAVMGGVTSYMEMPNTNPTTTTQTKLEEKYAIGAQTSLANYSYYIGATNDNFEEVARTDPHNVCGIKVFMGSSTGNMLVDNEKALERIFSEANILVATHCEDEHTVRQNMADFQAAYGDQLTALFHAKIRSVKACKRSSSLAVAMAKRFGTRLHVLHISTKDELDLFSNAIPLSQKRITSEVCVHHLTYMHADYHLLGNQIKCNPAIKSRMHRDALLTGLLDDRLDVIATDHAPHTWEEKCLPYTKAPSGLPLIQHTLNMMLDFHAAGKISLERIVEKMCHAPAIAFQVKERGFLDEGYWADLAIVDVNAQWKVSKDNIAHKCGWSPLDGKKVHGKVHTTIVSGHLAWHNGQLHAEKMGERMLFDRL